MTCYLRTLSQLFATIQRLVNYKILRKRRCGPLSTLFFRQLTGACGRAGSILLAKIFETKKKMSCKPFPGVAEIECQRCFETLLGVYYNKHSFCKIVLNQRHPNLSSELIFFINFSCYCQQPVLYKKHPGIIHGDRDSSVSMTSH